MARTPKPATDRAGQIYRALRHAIIEQALEPGAKLPEDAIGKRFGASRTIVRHALGQLAAEGLARLADYPLHVLVRADVALGDERARDALGQLPDPFLDALALVRERELGAFLGEPPRDRPGDRTLVGDAENEAALPFESTHAAILRRRRRRRRP